MRIAILYICTGKYKVFWKDFYLSSEKRFIPKAEKHYFVFTDAKEIEFENENSKIHKIFQKNLGWPDNTLRRFEMFLNIKHDLINFDYVFFFNANLMFMEDISDQDFLPINNEQLVACIHPGFYKKNTDKFPYEYRDTSTAYIEKRNKEFYFCGGINGGKTKDFIEAMEKMQNNIKKDDSNDIVALWHDESHWNKYICDDKKIFKILTPDFLYPEGFNLKFEPKLLLRSKDRFFNTQKMHKQKRITKSGIKKILNKIIAKIKYLIFNLFDCIYYSKIILKIKSKKTTTNNNEIKISVAISSFHREKLIHKSLFNILNDNRIDEIVVLDDGSSIESFKKTKKIIENIKNKKIKLYRRENNLGVLPTKIEAVSLCKNDWVILLDSDNTICKSYIDGIYKCNWSENTIYSPAFAYPLLDFRKISNQKIDFKKLKDLLIKETLVTERFLNDGNFFFNKNKFMELISIHKFIPVQASDIIFINYIWLINNNNIYIIPNTKYLHRVHIKSIWKELQQSSSKIFEYLRFNILLEKKKTPEEIEKDLGKNPVVESKIEKII